jgi:hypothetical protein
MPVPNVTDELCGMTVESLAIGVAADDPVVRLVPLAHNLVRRLGLQPILEVRHGGQQIAVGTEWAGFNLVDDLR